VRSHLAGCAGEQAVGKAVLEFAAYGLLQHALQVKTTSAW
jgi:hypothetical protein